MNFSSYPLGTAKTHLNLHPDYNVKTVALDTKPKISIVGIRVEVDYDISNYHSFDKLARVIMTSGALWRESDYL